MHASTGLPLVVVDSGTMIEVAKIRASWSLLFLSVTRASAGRLGDNRDGSKMLVACFNGL